MELINWAALLLAGCLVSYEARRMRKRIRDLEKLAAGWQAEAKARGWPEPKP
jgi:hypothetical protein